MSKPMGVVHRNDRPYKKRGGERFHPLFCAAIALYITPVKILVLLAGLFFLRHPMFKQNALISPEQFLPSVTGSSRYHALERTFCVRGLWSGRHMCSSHVSRAQTYLLD